MRTRRSITYAYTNTHAYINTYAYAETHTSAETHFHTKDAPNSSASPLAAVMKESNRLRWLCYLLFRNRAENRLTEGNEDNKCFPEHWANQIFVLFVSFCLKPLHG